MDSATPSYTTVDEYIHTFPQEVQDILQKLRQTIKEEAPEAEEKISYQMPTFKLHGSYLVYFAAWKDHISLYPATSALAPIKGLARYKTGKGTFQFPLSEPLPFDLIRTVVAIRAKENLERKAKKSSR